MTTDIFISNVAGNIPTVNQLERTKAHIGYNRIDSILYGLKIVGGVKTVTMLGMGSAPGSPHDRIHAMDSVLDHAAVDEYDRGKIPQANAVTGEWELVAMPEPVDGIMDWNTNVYQPYASKQKDLMHYYLGNEDPSGSDRLNLDADFYASYVRSAVAKTESGLAGSYIYAKVKSGYYPSTALRAVKLTANTGYASLYSKDESGYMRYIPLYVGSYDNTGNHLIVDNYEDKFTINLQSVYFSKGTASKFLALDENKKVIFSDADNFSHFKAGVDNTLYDIYNYNDASHYIGIDFVAGDGISLNESSSANKCLQIEISSSFKEYEGWYAGDYAIASGYTVDFAGSDHISITPSNTGAGVYQFTFEVTGFPSGSGHQYYPAVWSDTDAISDFNSTPRWYFSFPSGQQLEQVLSLSSNISYKEKVYPGGHGATVGGAVAYSGKEMYISDYGILETNNVQTGMILNGDVLYGKYSAGNYGKCAEMYFASAESFTSEGFGTTFNLRGTVAGETSLSNILSSDASGNVKIGLLNMITAEGGFAVKYTAGQALTRGMIVEIGSTNNNVVKSSASSTKPVGVVLASVNSGSDVWIVVSGKAYVLAASGVTLTRGYYVYTSSTAGYANNSSGVPATYNTEIGHVVSTGSSGGLALCVLHF